MLIVSPFHDYYDTATSYGMDKDCVYKREKYEIPYNFKQLYTNNFDNKFGSITIDRFILGFCGKIYPVIKVLHVDDCIHTERFLYNYEEAIDCLGELGIKLDNSHRAYGFFFSNHRDTYYGVKKFYESDYSSYQKIFLDNNIPVFCLQKSDVIQVNPTLKDFGFYRVMNPFTCFQELFMYLSGVIGKKEVKTVEVSDKVKLYKKGFDDKSFKKEPGKRGKNNGKRI